MKVLLIGDVVGSPGRRMFMREVPRLKREMGLSAVVVNAENCAAGSGLTAALAKGLFDSGADAITLGDHTWGQKEFPGEIGSLERVVRPANFASECPGRGWTVVTLPVGRFAVVNVQGRVFMQTVDCPFKAMDRVLNEIPKDLPVFVDFHAEATSEDWSVYLVHRARPEARHAQVRHWNALALRGGGGSVRPRGRNRRVRRADEEGVLDRGVQDKGAAVAR